MYFVFVFCRTGCDGGFLAMAAKGGNRAVLVANEMLVGVQKQFQQCTPTWIEGRGTLSGWYVVCTH